MSSREYISVSHSPTCTAASTPEPTPRRAKLPAPRREMRRREPERSAGSADDNPRERGSAVDVVDVGVLLHRPEGEMLARSRTTSLRSCSTRMDPSETRSVGAGPMFTESFPDSLQTFVRAPDSDVCAAGIAFACHNSIIANVSPLVGAIR
jgi:hypothetical protein